MTVLLLTVLLLIVSCTPAPAEQTTGYPITADAYGPVRLGMSASDLERLLQDYDSDEAAYDQDYGCYYLSKAGEPNSVDFMIVDERVVRFDVNAESKIKTKQMIGIGSSKQDVLTAYDNVSVSEHPYLGAIGEYLEVSLENGNGLIFETHLDQVTSYRLGLYPHVGYIEGCL